MTVTYESFVDRLEVYADGLWEHHPPTKGSVGYSDEIGTLSRRRALNVLNTARKFKMPMTIVGLGWFSDIGVAIYENYNNMALILGGEIRPTQLFVLSQNHLDPNDFPWATKKNGSVNDAVWDFFKEYTHSEENLQRLKFYGLKPPQDKGHYAY